LQNAPFGARIKRVPIHPEHHVHPSFSHLHTFYQGTDDVALAAPICFFQTACHLLAKLFQSTDYQPQFRFERFFVGELLSLFFEFVYTLTHTSRPGLEFILFDETLGVAVDQAHQTPP
jgi:hypothetical protein